ncbi:hypothetical protein BJ165DRAFT_1402470 [Panaeolus papilionaceus]|nr:hypothetical protein BJ165DRAFT_1402470 [Panaeolus papilionaceus]
MPCGSVKDIPVTIQLESVISVSLGALNYRKNGVFSRPSIGAVHCMDKDVIRQQHTPLVNIFPASKPPSCIILGDSVVTIERHVCGASGCWAPNGGGHDTDILKNKLKARSARLRHHGIFFVEAQFRPRTRSAEKQHNNRASSRGTPMRQSHQPTHLPVLLDPSSLDMHFLTVIEGVLTVASQGFALVLRKWGLMTPVLLPVFSYSSVFGYVNVTALTKHDGHIFTLRTPTNEGKARSVDADPSSWFAARVLNLNTLMFIAASFRGVSLVEERAWVIISLALLLPFDLETVPL